MASYLFMLGGLNVWINDFLIEHFGVAPINASLINGSVIIVNGISGNIIGPSINDY